LQCAQTRHKARFLSKGHHVQTDCTPDPQARFNRFGRLFRGRPHETRTTSGAMSAGDPHWDSWRSEHPAPQPPGRAIATIMATLAELELELGRERRAASRGSRRIRGLAATKPPKLRPRGAAVAPALGRDRRALARAGQSLRDRTSNRVPLPVPVAPPRLSRKPPIAMAISSLTLRLSGPSPRAAPLKAANPW
jgi:hypothetical protein